MDDVEILPTGTPAKGAYRVECGDKGEAFMSWTGNEAVRSVNHTFVPEGMRGMGIAGKMLSKLLDDARSQSFKIIAKCPYVAGQFARHPEWSDLLALE